MATGAERDEVLRRLSALLQAVVRLEGAVLVGSVAAGTADDQSDVDLIAVVREVRDADSTYRELAGEIPRHLTVVHRSDTPFARSNRLLGFLLALGEDPDDSGATPGGHLLQLDLSIVPLEELRARQPAWRVLFDRSGAVTRRLETTSVDNGATQTENALRDKAWLIDAAAFRVLECAKALRRGRVWQASLALHELRDFTLTLACLTRFPAAAARVSTHRLTDDLPAELLAAIADTLSPVEASSLAAALQQATRLMLDEARTFCAVSGADYPEPLARALLARVASLVGLDRPS